jgi:transcriptional regulator GlxA family with amidase domain
MCPSLKVWILASSVAHASCLQRVKCNLVAKRPMSGAPQLGVFSGCTRKREALIPFSERVHGVHGGLSPVRTQRICEYIAANLERKIRLETLAEMGGLSVRTLDVALKDLAVGRHTNI